MTLSTIDVPDELCEEAQRLAEQFDSVSVERVESDLPGFDRYRIFASDEGEDAPSSMAYRLVLTVDGGVFSLTPEETADVMWALAAATGRNRRHADERDAGREHDPVRAARFDRQCRIMQAIASAAA